MFSLLRMGSSFGLSVSALGGDALSWVFVSSEGALKFDCDCFLSDLVGDASLEVFLGVGVFEKKFKRLL